jgi:hypothetical protein
VRRPAAATIFRAPSIPDPARLIALADFLAASTPHAHAKDYTRVNTILVLHYCKRDRLKAKFGRLTMHFGVCIGIVGKSNGIGLMTPDSGSAALTEDPGEVAIVSTSYRHVPAWE